MYAQLFVQILAAASTAAAATIERRACGETAKRVCFGRDGGVSQNIDVEDLQWVADLLRYEGKKAKGEAGEFYTMPSGLECQEWGIDVAGAGTVYVLAKHIK